MYKASVEIRIRYADTDQMGIVYYGNYCTFYEIARTEALRKLGFSYKLMEEKGIIMPVIKLNIKYIKPAYYDDVINISAAIKEKPSVKINFDYEIFNVNNLLINSGNTVLAFINKQNNKPVQAPNWFLEALNPYF